MKVAIDVMTLLSSIQDRIQGELKLNMNDYKNTSTIAPEDEEEGTKDVDNTERKYNSAI